MIVYEKDVGESFLIGIVGEGASGSEDSRGLNTICIVASVIVSIRKLGKQLLHSSFCLKK